LGILVGANLSTLVAYKIDIFILYILYIRQIYQKSFFFQKNPNKKALQQKTKGLKIVRLPRTGRF